MKMIEYFQVGWRLIVIEMGWLILCQRPVRNQRMPFP